MRIVVTGSRRWTDSDTIRAVLRDLDDGTPITLLIHGDCRGADRTAASVAHQLGIRTLAYPANWKELGKAAGPFRNRAMLDDWSPELVVGFHGDYKNSKGTKDCIQAALQRKIPVMLVRTFDDVEMLG